jgi:hypothetical protein
MSDRRTLANRTNASNSTGPQSENGKAIACQNALRHGLRSRKPLLEDEDADALAALQSEMHEALAPVGAVELALADRIVMAVWRQQRLERAEAAALAIGRRQTEILDQLKRLHDYNERDEIDAASLEPFDAEQVTWCRAVLDEVVALEEFTLEELEKSAPHAWAQLKGEADEDNETPEEYLSGFENGLAEYLSELCRWCRRQLDVAGKRPQLLAIVQQLRERGLVLPAAQLDVMSRYQTTLDNQLYKALRAYREAQEWRLKTLDHVEDGQTGSDAEEAD